MSKENIKVQQTVIEQEMSITTFIMILYEEKSGSENNKKNRNIMASNCLPKLHVEFIYTTMPRKTSFLCTA